MNFGTEVEVVAEAEAGGEAGASATICTRQVSIGMLFAQARAVMREFDATR